MIMMVRSLAADWRRTSARSRGRALLRDGARPPPTARRDRIIEQMAARSEETFTPERLAPLVDATSRDTVRNMLLVLAEKGRIVKVGEGQYRAQSPDAPPSGVRWREGDQEPAVICPVLKTAAREEAPIEGAAEGGSSATATAPDDQAILLLVEEAELATYAKGMAAVLRVLEPTPRQPVHDMLPGLHLLPREQQAVVEYALANGILGAEGYNLRAVACQA